MSTQQQTHNFAGSKDRPVLDAYVNALGTPRGRVGRAMLRILEDAKLIAWTDGAVATYLDRRHLAAFDAFGVAEKRPFKNSLLGHIGHLKSVRAAKLEFMAASSVDRMFHLRLRNAQQAARRADSSGSQQ